MTQTTPATPIRPVTIVAHRDGWCALAKDATLDPDAWNDPTLCGLWVNGRVGSDTGVPDCPDCLAILAGLKPSIFNPRTRQELVARISELEAEQQVTLPREIRVWLNHDRYWLQQSDGPSSYSKTPSAAAAKAWRILR